MRSLITVLVCTVLLIPTSIIGAEQVGTISSSATFTLRGAPVPAPAQSLPLMTGDEIVVGVAAVTIVLADGSSFVLEPGSHVWVERQGSQMTIGIAKGKFQYKVVPGSTVKVCALGRPILLEAASEGTVSIEAPDRVHAVASRGTIRIEEKKTCKCDGMPVAVAKKWWTGKKVIVTTAMAGGAATAVTLSATHEEEPSSVSPSKP
jgi:hypothetical protein